MSNPIRRALWLAARLRVGIRLGVSAGLDATLRNASPLAPIRESPLILAERKTSAKNKTDVNPVRDAKGGQESFPEKSPNYCPLFVFARRAGGYASEA